jgi:predicted small lipoprotein YifL
MVIRPLVIHLSMRLLTSALILSCLLLGGCGQKGPLVPPQPQARTYAASAEMVAP